jgi:hypothetical protein
MLHSRRVFLASSTACLLGGLATQAEAATASRSRLFVSDWPLALIGRELVLGVGYTVLTSEKVADVIAGIGAGRLKTRLETFRGAIDVEIEGLAVTLDGKPIPDRVQYYLAGLKMMAELHATKPLELPDLGQIIDEEFVQRVRAAVEKVTLEYSYRIRYHRVYVSTSTTIRKGQLRKVVNLLCPVGQVQGLRFVSDSQERCGKTHITSSLWIDYCVGRREGPIVRRIAEREIGCREDAMLYRLEQLVLQVVRGKRDVEELRKVVPDLLRRIETQEIG